MRTDLTFRILKTYLSNNNIHVNDETFYKNFNLLAPSGKFNLMAEILSDDNMYSIKVAVFKGKDKSTFLKKSEYGNTCLISALEKVIRYAEALNETYVDVSVRPRREKHLFNIEAFKEAWINACVHNNWVEKRPPAVFWFVLFSRESLNFGSINRFNFIIFINVMHNSISKVSEIRIAKRDTFDHFNLIVYSFKITIVKFFIAKANKRNSKTDNKQEGKNEGVLISDVGYIKSSIDRIEKNMDKLEDRYNLLSNQLTKTEESVAQAHKRITEHINDKTKHKGGSNRK